MISTHQILLVTWMMLTLAYPALANDCEDKLEKAKELFNTGRPELVRGELGDCLTKLEGAKQVDAYKLLILAELAADNHQAAELALKDLLRRDPEFIPEEGMSKEFVSLYQGFKVAPVISLGGFASYNWVRPIVLTDYNADGYSSEGQYSPSISYQFGAGFDIYLSPSFQLHTGAAYRFDIFTYQNDLLGFSRVTLQHTHESIILPMTLKYLINQNRYGYFIHGGLAFKKLLNANLDQFETTSSVVNDINIDGPKRGISGLMRPNSFQAILGVGRRIKVPSGYLSADLSYSLSFQNMTKAEKRYSDPSLAFEFGYVLDDFRMDNLMITLGYYYSVYNAKKKK